jgi:hypothetical protein
VFSEEVFLDDHSLLELEFPLSMLTSLFSEKAPPCFVDSAASEPDLTLPGPSSVTGASLPRST